MPFDLNTFIGANIGETVAKIVGLFKVSPEKALEAQTELTKIQLDLEGKLQDAVTKQLEVNLQEAKSDKLFVAGWRPAVGWCCAAIFATNFIIGPIVNWVFVMRHIPGAFPKMDLSEAMPVLLGMLGLGAYRTYEKTQLGSSSVGH